MTQILVGSTIVGASGKKLIVDRVDGDTIYSGKMKVKASAVIKVIPPVGDIDNVLEVGDMVYIPWCDKTGRLERIFNVKGNGLYGQVRQQDGKMREVLMNCLTPAPKDPEIEEVTEMLKLAVKYPDDYLTTVRKVYGKDLLAKAAQLLPTDTKAKLRELVIAANNDSN